MPRSRIKFPTFRYRILPSLLGIWVGIVAVRLIHLQTVQFEELTRQARRQQERTIELSPPRAVIYDRNLQPLAISVEVESLFAVPREISNPDETARSLARVLNMERSDMRARLSGTRSKHFSWIKREITAREAKRIRELDLPGIYFQDENKRFYPKRELAAHVLGYVGVDDQGLAGIELVHEETIRGKPGQFLIERDARQRGFGRTGRAPEPGQSVVLTLDETIQYIAERELASAMEESRALAGTVLVLDPFTGEVLAMANAPTFNPNRYSDVEQSVLRNRAIADAYEPGSTFKIITVAAALEEGVTNPNEIIDCQMGSIVLAGRTIRDWKAFGMLSVTEILRNSSNIGAIKLAIRVGDQQFYRYWRSFGFGSPTGVGLPGEAAGLTKPPERWSRISIGAMAMGQEIGVTPLQLATAASVVANGGWWVQPRILRGQAPETPTGNVDPATARRVLNPRSADQLQRILAEVVNLGTGKLARPAGYTAAGKTGTAQKIDPATGRYSSSDHVASFVGFVPADSPMFTILAVLDSPRGRYHGGDAAAPIFRRVAEQVLAYRNVPVLFPGESPVLQAAASQPQDLPPMSDYEEPDPTVPISLTSSIRTPDILGKTVRAATEQALGERWMLHPIGSGIAVRQFPTPGTPVADGEKITVWFRISGRPEQEEPVQEKPPSASSGIAPAPAAAPPASSPMRPDSAADVLPVPG